VSLTAGTRLGPYEIVASLGAGGMGEVYRARDPRLGREVAVKVLPEEFSHEPERLRRFETEARSASALSDAHIVTVFDIGESNGQGEVAQEIAHEIEAELTAGSSPGSWSGSQSRHFPQPSHEKVPTGN
jgi:eukaryotic-like serine/threonine-protein kinase